MSPLSVLALLLGILAVTLQPQLPDVATLLWLTPAAVLPWRGRSLYALALLGALLAIWQGQRLLDRPLGDLVEADAERPPWVELQLVRDVAGDGLALAIGVAGEQHAVRLVRLALEFGEAVKAGETGLEKDRIFEVWCVVA